MTRSIFANLPSQRKKGREALIPRFRPSEVSLAISPSLPACLAQQNSTSEDKTVIWIVPKHQCCHSNHNSWMLEQMLQQRQ
ncbi:unnamed protein product [Mycena citricolor]|uniref:Uncharacterized protein n=1 Tax=Mycena citricolor TaxID=2018698 RepID=A0AAD2K2Y4_9AGAR|nr:unnamed protein product [Mycena citricolor]